MQTHPALAAAGYEIAASEGALDQASRLRNPEAAFITEDVRRNRATMTAQLNIPLELGGKRAARTRAAELAAARRVQAGKVSPVEQTKAGVARASAAIELRDAGAELLVAQRALSAFWGGAAAAPQADGSAETLPVVPPDARQPTSALDNAPRVIRARLEINRRQALANVERSKRVPDVTVNVGVKRDSSANNNMAVLGIAVPLPLFDRNQGNLLEAQRLADKAFEDYRALQLEQNATLAQDVARLDAARAAVQSLRQDVLPGARRAYDAARIGFDAGKFNFLDVLDAQRTLFQARAQYLAALSRAHQAAAGIDRILGR